MSLKLLVSTDSLAPPLTGIGYYVAHLMHELLSHDEIEICGVGDRGVRDRTALLQDIRDLLREEAPEATGLPVLSASFSSSPSSSPDVTARLLSYARRLAHSSTLLDALARRGRQLRQQRALSAYRGWLLHANYVPPPHAGPTVITVPDLSHIRYPQTHPRGRRQWLGRELPGALERAEHIFAISRFTRNELLALGLVRDERRISVVHLGHSAGFRPRPDDELSPRLARWGLRPRGYVLSLATLEPRKNFRRLLQAYQALPAALARDYPLVLTGASGWKNAGLMADIQQVRPPHKVVVTGYLDRSAVQDLMAGAAVFAYLSLYEGFGLPALEALASGTPVLTSSGGAMEEVVADSGYCVDPLDTEAIGDGLCTLLEQPLLADRLRLAGLARAAEFSWERCAREHLSVYRSVAS